ncbi:MULTISPECIES: hypothetical protein [Bacillus]|nr:MULTISPECIES: hypothetical protein [Bacillus]KFN07681.1 hypothetical protein DJ94_5580 [Bacillus pseudomycoides]MCR8859528.1 hypothetical protein [Bacillus pseudomycoides]MCX2828498.1 hypothetical protein [Bacillus sp. DHT2]MDR4914913.1 hypothetical protein [Bacillus pseudomycoides]MED0856743.1 hypothetical protein [Bacillus pseudomycoides]
MISYQFDTIQFKSGNKSLIIKMEDEKKYLIATFLMSDIQGASPSYAINAIDAVLNEEIEYTELSGNVCGLEIRKEETSIYDNLADDGMGDWCKIDTKELRKLILIWTDAVKKFREENPK